MIQIKFRRAHFDINGRFIQFTYWGLLDHKGNFDARCFKSPSIISGCHSYVDEQFTGLKDKNGKDIYEGDLIKRHYLYEVKWGYGNFYLHNKDDHHLSISNIKGDFEIIGNIHEK